MHIENNHHHILINIKRFIGLSTCGLCLVLVSFGCTPSSEQLVAAVKTCHVKTLERGRKHLSQHINDAEVLLKPALEANQHECVRWLLMLPVRPQFTMAQAADSLQAAPDTHRPLVQDAKMARLLLKHGATGTTYLLPIAVKSKDVKMASAVLASTPVQKLKANKPPMDLTSHLYRASTHAGYSVPVKQKDWPMMKVLLEHSADPLPHILSAIKDGNLEMFKSLVTHSKRGAVAMNMVVHEKSFKQRAQFLQWMLAQGHRDKRALTVVATTDDVASAKILLKNGSTDIDSALMNARHHKRSNMIQVLEQAKARMQPVAPPTPLVP